MLQPKKTPGDTKWFVKDRFGMFIHWGLYSMPARHEWVRNQEQISNEDYDAKYFKRFDPDLYDPVQWAKAAKQAGMKYFVITTKHHEGFCLWDTKFTDYKAPNTPAKRDLLKPMIDAFRAEGIRVGLYHSLLDWHHPYYPQDIHFGPHRFHTELAKFNAGRSHEKYADYLHKQVRELLTKFGDIDVMWFDFSYPRTDGTGRGKDEWQSEKLYKMIRKLQPDVILNDRLDLPSGWDVKTPEQFQPREWPKVDGQPVVWETCQTFSGSWGYHRDEANWRTVDELIRTLVDSVSKGGNLLLNVGPTARGEFDERASERLQGIGEWMKRHARSIYGCTQAPEEFKCPPDCRLTYNPETRRLYIHVFAWPHKYLFLDGAIERIEYAQLLNDGSEIDMKLKDAHAQEGLTSGKSIGFNLPAQRPNVAVPVIELFLK